MRKSRIQLVRSREGRVWHLQVGCEAKCGASLKNAMTIAGEGEARDVIEATRSARLPLCPMCF